MQSKKKKILFTCGLLTIGGIQRSLVALLHEIDCRENIIDLMLGNIKGALVTEVPREVNIIEAPRVFQSFNFDPSAFRYVGNPRKLVEMIQDFFMYFNNNPKLVFIGFLKYLYYGFLMIIRGLGLKSARMLIWQEFRDSFNFGDYRDVQYDLAVAYSGVFSWWNEFIIDKVRARRKVCWIHGDYSDFGSKDPLEKLYISKFDQVFTVSETCRLSIEKEIPSLKNRVTVLHNIINKEQLVRLSESFNPFDDEFTGMRFVSVSRLTNGKGFDTAIKAMALAINNGCLIKWYIIGNGDEYLKLKNLISECKMDKNIILCGEKRNPYPFVKGADVFFHPSKSEGKSMSVDEAKLLKKPILITRFPTVEDQIKEGITGRIVDISLKGIYDGIREMYENEQLRRELAKNLEDFKISNHSASFFSNLLRMLQD